MLLDEKKRRAQVFHNDYTPGTINQCVQDQTRRTLHWQQLLQNSTKLYHHEILETTFTAKPVI